MPHAIPSPGARPALPRLALLLALALWSSPAATPARAQEGQHVRMRQVEDDYTLEFQLDGAVSFTADERAVQGLSPGGRLLIDERRVGEPARRVEYRDDGGGIETIYFVNGRRGELDAEGRAWLAKLLPEIALQQAIDPESRIRRVLAAGGVDSVLTLLARVRSDGATRRYYDALFEQARLRPDEAARALRQASRTIASDGDQMAVLAGALDRLDLEQLAVRDAYFAAATELNSDGDQSHVLRAVLDGPRRPSEAVAAAICRSAEEIHSDGDKAGVLVALVNKGLMVGPTVRDAFFQAVRTIHSDGDRARVLLSVLQRHSGADEVAEATLQSAREINSDGDKTRVLLAVHQDRLRNAAVRTAYESALQSVHSDGERRRAERHLGAGGR